MFEIPPRRVFLIFRASLHMQRVGAPQRFIPGAIVTRGGSSGLIALMTPHVNVLFRPPTQRRVLINIFMSETRPVSAGEAKLVRDRHKTACLHQCLDVTLVFCLHQVPAQ